MALSKGRYYQDALRALDRLSPQGEWSHAHELAAVVRLTVCIYMNDRPAATRALAVLPSLTEGSSHAYVRNLCQALLAMRQGNVAEAQQLLASVPEDACVAARHMVSVHVNSAPGLPLDTRRALDWLADRRGEEGLRGVVDTQGPASPVARFLLEGARGPYG